MNAIVQAPRFTYDTPLAEMLVAGKFHHMEKYFTKENFPPESRCQIKLPILHRFNRKITTNEVLEEFKKLNLRSATLREFLSFPGLATFNDNPVVVLDLDRGIRCPELEIKKGLTEALWVPALWLQVGAWEEIEGNVFRALTLADILDQNPWDSHYLFAAVHQ